MASNDWAFKFKALTINKLNTIKVLKNFLFIMYSYLIFLFCLKLYYIIKIMQNYIFFGYNIYCPGKKKKAESTFYIFV